jgi:prepilin-type N-terminal cleavage/methylation domain-containing protein
LIELLIVIAIIGILAAIAIEPAERRAAGQTEADMPICAHNAAVDVRGR